MGQYTTGHIHICENKLVKLFPNGLKLQNHKSTTLNLMLGTQTKTSVAIELPHANL